MGDAINDDRNIEANNALCDMRMTPLVVKIVVFLKPFDILSYYSFLFDSRKKLLLFFFFEKSYPHYRTNGY